MKVIIIWTIACDDECERKLHKFSILTGVHTLQYYIWKNGLLKTPFQFFNNASKIVNITIIVVCFICVSVLGIFELVLDLNFPIEGNFLLINKKVKNCFHSNKAKNHLSTYRLLWIDCGFYDCNCIFTRICPFWGYSNAKLCVTVFLYVSKECILSKECKFLLNQRIFPRLFIFNTQFLCRTNKGLLCLRMRFSNETIKVKNNVKSKHNNDGLPFIETFYLLSDMAHFLRFSVAPCCLSRIQTTSLQISFSARSV